jgi:hypothetical protein
MRSLAKTRLGGRPAAILAALSFAAATSASAADGLVINEQLQLGDVFSTQTLNVEEAPQGLSGTTTAVGNIVSGIGDAGLPMNFQSDQDLRARVEASTNAAVYGPTGRFFVTDTSATGNSGTAGTCCALTQGSSIQAIGASGAVVANATSRTDDNAASISVDTSAIGNTQGWNQRNGEIQAWTRQTNAGLVASTNTSTLVGGPGNIGLSATAVSNNVTGDVSGAHSDIGVEQDRTGAVQATVNAGIGWGTDVQTTATATGNLVNSQVGGPESAMNVRQTASAPLDATSNLALDEWFGEASTVGYGVGNSILMSNVGQQTTLYTEQTSGGDVNATASFSGRQGDGGVLASATAMGNAVSGYACAECAGDFGGFNRQVNDSRVRAHSNVVVTGRSGLISGEATAIGNSATYRVFSNGGR